MQARQVFLVLEVCLDVPLDLLKHKEDLLENKSLPFLPLDFSNVLGLTKE